MGFAEIFTFVIVGGVTVYYQRSQPQSKTPPVTFSWLILIGLPCFAIAWVITRQTDLSLMLAMSSFLLGIWIYGNWQPTVNTNLEASEICPLSDAEEQQLKNCFPLALYQLQSLEYRPSEIYCRGNLRSRNYKYAYDTVSQNIHNIFGDRFTCYLQETATENRGLDFGSSVNTQDSSRYAFYLLPVRPRFEPLANISYWVISGITLVMTAFSLLLIGSAIPNMPQEINLTNLQKGLPYLLGVSSVLIANTITKFFFTKKYRIPFHLPLLLPAFGGLGILASLNISDPPHPDRPQQLQILFDLAAFPNVASLGMSVILLLLGHWLLIPTESSSAALPSLLPSLTNFEFSNSVLVNFIHSISQLISLQAPVDNFEPREPSLILLSPLTLAGWTGLVITALQLLPFRFFDGGYIAIAMFGHRQATHLAKITRLLLLAIALLLQPWLRLYSLLLFVMPTPPRLIKNEGLQLGKRDILGMILMAIALLIILPIPKSIILR
ncbi:MAG: hypothetical protein AUK48_00470 [Oscillatoriales cyanobacterium CG2_30_44_21]|nr:MAG: hypothetical protein AUK48_00470 [Oscillatoriales cyanobacterium CG2_30_44_21]